MEQILSPQLLVSALVLASIYILIAFGLNLVYGTMRLLNVAHGELMMLGGYISFWIFNQFHLGTPVSIFVAMAVTAAFGSLFYLLVLRFLLGKSKFAARLEANSMIIFFGLSIIMQNMMSLAFGADPRSYRYLNNIWVAGDVRVELNRLLLLAISAVTTVLLLLFFRLSRQGLAARALVQQKDAAALAGINAERINLIVFCLGFALAGLAGALVSMIEAISPFNGFAYTIAAFIVIILGGLGNLLGGVLGAVLLAFIEIYGSALTSTAYRSILIYSVFVAVLCFRPQGLLGRKGA